MGDLICRQAAINALDKCHCGGKDENGRPWIYKENAVEAIEMVEPSPSAEPKKGRWIGKYPITSVCSECGFLIHDSKVKAFAFCPNCGADMRGEQDE